MAEQEGGFSPETVLTHLKSNNVTHVVWLPDSETNFLYVLMQDEPSLDLITVSREGQAFSTAAYRDRRAFKSWTDEVFADYIEGATRVLDDGRVELKCDPQVEETFYQNRTELDTAKVLRGLGGEYILLVGDYKGAQTPQDAAVQHLTRETKGFLLKELGVGSHFVPMEHPDLVLKEIRSFIDPS